MAMLMGIHTHSFSQSVLDLAAIQKHYIDSVITNKSILNRISNTSDGIIRKGLIDFMLENFDTLGSGTGGDLNTTLGLGNTSNNNINLGKKKSRFPYNSAIFSLNTTDSSGQLYLSDSGNLNNFLVIDKSRFISTGPIQIPYIIGEVGGSLIGSPTPSVDACAGTGSSATITVGSSYGSGIITITAGTSPCSTLNPFFYLTFSPVLFRVPFYVSIVPKNDAAAILWAAGGVLYCNGSTTSVATIKRTASTIIPGTVYQYYYHIED